MHHDNSRVPVSPMDSRYSPASRVSIPACQPCTYGMTTFHRGESKCVPRSNTPTSSPTIPTLAPTTPPSLAPTPPPTPMLCPLIALHEGAELMQQASFRTGLVLPCAGFFSLRPGVPGYWGHRPVYGMHVSGLSHGTHTKWLYYLPAEQMWVCGTELGSPPFDMTGANSIALPGSSYSPNAVQVSGLQVQ
jgi:hypothetical protein